MRRLTVSKPQLMPGGDDSRFRTFIHDFLAFSLCVDQCRVGFAHLLGISGVAYTTLVSVAHLQGDEGVGISAVADHLHLSGAFVTIEVSKLVKAGLIHKRTNQTDRRRVLLTLTPKARKLLDQLAEVQVPVNDALFGCLSASEFQQLSSMMARMAQCGDAGVSLLKFLMNRSASVPSQAPRRAARRH